MIRRLGRVIGSYLPRYLPSLPSLLRYLLGRYLIIVPKVTISAY